MCIYTIFNPPEGMYSFVEKELGPDCVHLDENGRIVCGNHMDLINAVKKYRNGSNGSNKCKTPEIEGLSCI